MMVTAALHRDGEWIVAYALDDEVTTQGPTIDEAIANLLEAVSLQRESPKTPGAWSTILVTVDTPD